MSETLYPSHQRIVVPGRFLDRASEVRALDRARPAPLPALPIPPPSLADFEPKPPAAFMYRGHSRGIQARSRSMALAIAALISGGVR